MSPRIRCSKRIPEGSEHPADTVPPMNISLAGPLTILGRVFTANERGPAGPEGHALVVMRDCRGQLVLTAGTIRIPIDDDDLRRIGVMCANIAVA